MKEGNIPHKRILPKKGLSEEEVKVKEKQTTFSLKKCITKYGEEKGLEVFNERQRKWQETLNNKSQEEIDDFNRRKSSGIGNINVQDKDALGILYYIRFYNDDIEFWKIGITTKTLDERFGAELIMENKHNLKRGIIS